ncbi:unnamed protein product [Kuraishia capsulata CBS 1993]|uniref:PNPLA domain-containing protein n=1 Tax=Kuraishia capsulata CBS 1993 TaxID=1382522 RepID=W6MVA8_9ASCO|nr:uncharacterized protein KUCA_T00005851001 [Kuraishia capsulata CBS 1993]CDK29857.1 unnamed protein product [Kuraishia capsulata CBS 1993]
MDILLFWAHKIFRMLVKKRPISVATRRLGECKSYSEWSQVAAHIDSLDGGNLWRRNFISRLYDYELINDRLLTLQDARLRGDYLKIISVFRAGLLRNFGGIAAKELYTRAYSGTKTLIEEYIDEVLECLNFIHEFESDEDYSTISNFNQIKLDFFHDARQTFGSTALILQGGSLFGLCHLGVVKALNAKGLLPRIISGSAVGAIVAAFVCVLADSELSDISSITETLIASESKDFSESTTGDIIEYVTRNGYSHDILTFAKYVRQRLGDLTFEETYLKTERILNVLVHPTDASIPPLLNYVTTPNIVVWSALTCSVGDGVFMDSPCLYIKNQDGEIRQMETYRECHFLTPHQASDGMSMHEPHSELATLTSPYTRLTELFNVNHFVVSLARPYLSPLIGNDLKHGSNWYPERLLKTVLGLEFQHRVNMLDRMGILFSWIKRLAIDEKTPRRNASGITIVPGIKTLVRDFGRVFDVNKSNVNIPYWILVGDRSVWPLYPILWTRIAIEFALDDYYSLHRKM